MSSDMTMSDAAKGLVQSLAHLLRTIRWSVIPWDEVPWCTGDDVWPDAAKMSCDDLGRECPDQPGGWCRRHSLDLNVHRNPGGSGWRWFILNEGDGWSDVAHGWAPTARAARLLAELYAWRFIRRA